MPDLYLTYLSRPDVEAAALADQEILTAIEAGLAMQGRGETVIEPRVHLEPRAGAEGHFNVLRGFLGGQIGMAGVKVVGDFVGNYAHGLPGNSDRGHALPVSQHPATRASRTAGSVTAAPGRGR